MRTTKTMIRLRGSASLLGSHVKGYIFERCGSFINTARYHMTKAVISQSYKIKTNKNVSFRLTTR